MLLGLVRREFPDILRRLWLPLAGFTALLLAVLADQMLWPAEVGRVLNLHAAQAVLILGLVGFAASLRNFRRMIAGRQGKKTPA